MALGINEELTAHAKSFKAQAKGLAQEHTKNEGAMGSFHTVLKEEQNSFSDWINGNMQKLDSVKHLLPLHPEGDDLYEKVDDGIILW